MAKTSTSFKKGDGRAGRKKGIPNKTTQDFKEAVIKLLESCQNEMIQWLKEIDDPKDRFDVIAKISEFAYPKLARTDHTSGDKPIEVMPAIIIPQDMTIEQWNKRYKSSHPQDK
jgi:hypothetical protein